jgi:mono/diheme cytochrome c family protein
MKLIFAALLLAGLGLFAGCASTENTSASAPTGQRLWSQNCARCHNTRSPSDYNNVQWDVAMLHMRIRANLTAEEHGKIQRFLQSGE